MKLESVDLVKREFIRRGMDDRDYKNSSVKSLKDLWILNGNFSKALKNNDD